MERGLIFCAWRWDCGNFENSAFRNYYDFSLLIFKYREMDTDQLNLRDFETPKVLNGIEFPKSQIGKQINSLIH